MRVGPQRDVDYGAAALIKLPGVSVGFLSVPNTECPRHDGQTSAGIFWLVVLSQTVAVIKAENQVIEEIQYLARGGPDESRSGWR
jgi:hypothetical protein